jgi:hypothetical protein
MNLPVVADPYEEMRDDSHIRLLIIFHYVMGILELLGGLAFMGVAIFMGKMMRQISTLPTTVPTPAPVPVGGSPVVPSISTPPTAPPAELMDGMADMIFFIYGGMALATIVLAILTLLSARGMATRKWEILSLLVAGLQCLSIPFGTVLGVFTFIVLLRPSVALQYQRNKPPET